MRYRFYITDVFTHTPFGGNPLAVLPEAAGISAAGMQHIAREFNFAETTFVVPASEARYTKRVRIFTPMAELKFAGHPTIGTACALVRGGHVGSRDNESAVQMVLEEGVGPIQATVTRPDGAAALEASFTLHAKLEQPRTTVDTGAAAAVLRLESRQVLGTFFAGIGVNFTFVHLADAAAVDAAVLDHAAWATHMSGCWAPQVFLYAHDMRDASQLYARMFAPALGVAEDPATGSACGALAAVLAGQSGATAGAADIRVTQGAAMGRRSEIRASATVTAAALEVTVGGACVQVAEGHIDVPAQWLE
jgi:trans-2,3-dihydro-3-hydroxyanthranilate isomerase